MTYHESCSEVPKKWWKEFTIVLIRIQAIIIAPCRGTPISDTDRKSRRVFRGGADTAFAPPPPKKWNIKDKKMPTTFKGDLLTLEEPFSRPNWAQYCKISLRFWGSAPDPVYFLWTSEEKSQETFAVTVSVNLRSVKRPKQKLLDILFQSATWSGGVQWRAQSWIGFWRF